MPDTQTQLQWDDEVLAKYKAMIEHIPMFHRDIAKTVVNKRAEILAKERGSDKIEEEDVVKAFFKEVPMTFYSLMIRLLDQAGFDYRKYEGDN